MDQSGIPSQYGGGVVVECMSSWTRTCMQRCPAGSSPLSTVAEHFEILLKSSLHSSTCDPGGTALART